MFGRFQHYAQKGRIDQGSDFNYMKVQIGSHLL